MQNEKCKIKKSLVTLFVLAMGWFLIVAKEVRAAVYVLEVPQYAVQVGQETEVRIKVDTEGERINVFNVSVVIPAELEFGSVDKGQSAVNLWVQEPVFTEANRTLTFIGGVPGGAAGGNLELLGVQLRPKQAGTLKLQVSEKSEAYLNDGFGTPAPIQTPEAVLVASEAGSAGKWIWLSALLVAGLGVGFLSWWLWYRNKKHHQEAS